MSPKSSTQCPKAGVRVPCSVFRALRRPHRTEHGTRNTFAPSRLTPHAFTLMEVMIACGIFFTATFAILALVSNTLRNARALRHVEVDAGLVAAMLSRTNHLTEGTESGDLDDFGYPDYRWETETYAHEVYTNGLVQVKITLRKRDKVVEEMPIWVFDPNFRSSMPRGGI